MSNSLRHLAPEFSIDEAKEIAMKFYNLNEFVCQLPSERDQNFLFQNNQSKFILKISNISEIYSIIDMQNCVMEHINTSSRCLPSLDGQMIITYKNHFIRLINYLPGVPLGNYQPHTAKLLINLGKVLGEIDKSLYEFKHESMKRDLYWNMMNAEKIINTYKHLIINKNHYEIIEDILKDWIKFVIPQVSLLRCSVIHNDANDYNIIVTDEETVGLIDFGDLCETFTVCEAAIACAYIMLDKDDPIDAATNLIYGYNEIFPFEKIEIDLIYYFIRMRLAMSVTISAHQKQIQPKNQYLVISEKPAWNLLEKLTNINSNIAHQTFRSICHFSN
ncbi:unnamed protein product [Adineta steineri]|uniref:Hydroxylysine kinase n=2 Tax=Adineta steineri TaxID=433720 RepID=A0A819S6K5_9BILA|nr:unnamed protein product [Adineta steineri]